MDLTRWHLGEPALLMGFVQAVIALAVSFGLHLTADQIAGIMGLSGAVLAIIVRQNVSPTQPGASK